MILNCTKYRFHHNYMKRYEVKVIQNSHNIVFIHIEFIYLQRKTMFVTVF